MHQCYTNYAKQVYTKSAAWKRWRRLHGMKIGLTIEIVKGIAIRVVSALQGANQYLTNEKVMPVAIQVVFV